MMEHRWYSDTMDLLVKSDEMIQQDKSAGRVSGYKDFEQDWERLRDLVDEATSLISTGGNHSLYFQLMDLLVMRGYEFHKQSRLTLYMSVRSNIVMYGTAMRVISTVIDIARGRGVEILDDESVRNAALGLARYVYSSISANEIVLLEDEDGFVTKSAIDLDWVYSLMDSIHTVQQMIGLSRVMEHTIRAGSTDRMLLPIGGEPRTIDADTYVGQCDVIGETVPMDWAGPSGLRLFLDYPEPHH